MLVESFILTILIIFSLIDINTRAIPSIILTLSIAIVLVLRPEFLINGILLGLFGLFLYELTDEVFGLADIKVLVIIGLMIPTIFGLSQFLLLFSFLQFVYILILNSYFKIDSKEIPMIPLLTVIYAIIIFGGFY